MSDIATKYLKYIIIALALAAVSHAMVIYLFKTTYDMREDIHNLDKELAVLNTKMGYLATNTAR